jgi:diketogulonate reductase-like aldo/keto reductase
LDITITSTKTLNNGVEAPLLGLGVFQNPAGETTRNAILSALESGYRHVDTAKIYRNERSVGEAIRANDIPREQIFVTTKLWRDDVGYDSALRAVDTSLGALGLDYIDLYLIHWPTYGKRRDGWRAMERILELGKARAIGVSNFMAWHLEELLGYANVIPAVNQIELSPYNYQYRKEVVDLCRAQGIALEAYSPLTKAQKLNDPKLLRLAQKYDKTAAQILIRWVLQQDIIALPKSVNPDRIRQNADVFDFEISEADMANMETFNENLVTGWDPTNAP